VRGARALLVSACTLVVTACSSEGPISGPGEMTATLVGPHGAEGAALVVLLGEGIGEVSSLGSTEVFAGIADGSVQVVLIDQTGGDLSFRVALADTTRRPEAIVQQVAGPDDELRTLEGYSVELRR
jgi:hypothetical protein